MTPRVRDFITGQLGRLYVHLTPAAFWATHIAICATALLFLALAGPAIARGLARPAHAPSDSLPNA